VWRRKWILLPIVVLIPLATYLVSKGLPKSYEATTLVQVRDTGTSAPLGQTNISFSSSSASEAARLIPTTAVARQAAKQLGEPPEQGPTGIDSVSANVDDAEAGFLTITVTSDNAERAADAANAFAEAIGATRASEAIIDIDETIRSLTAEASQGDEATQSELAQQLQQLRALKASLNDATQVIEPAAAPGSPVSPNPRRNATVAFVLALLLAAGLVPLLEGLDRRLRNPDELEEEVGAPVLATIPTEAFPGAVPGPHVREAFQTLRAALTYFNVDRTVTKVMITSAQRADGKTTVATNLAIALAEEGRDVVVVDCDLRRPQVAKRLGVGEDVHYGIEEVITERRSLPQALVNVEVEGGRLRVLPGGSPPPNPSVITGSERMRTLLAKLSEQVDMVIIDTPPLLPVSDAIPLLEQVSGTIMVARMDQTSRDSLRRARRLISSANGNVLGVVATGIKAGGLYGYGYGYGYESEAAGDGGDGAVPSRGRGFLGLGGRRGSGES
jgi:capsular exopolysaccharide synthesis family protein